MLQKVHLQLWSYSSATHQPLKKGQFKWTKEADDAFKALKQAMTSIPTLARPNFNEPFVIESHASGAGIGVVLTQQGRPIAFMS